MLILFLTHVNFIFNMG